MSQRLNFVWRLVATAVSYAAFGVGGVLIYALYPMLQLLPIDDQQKQRYGRRIIHWSFKSFIGLMHRLGIYTYEFHGAEQLQAKGQLIVANHPSLIDVCFLLSRIPETNCIVRGGLSRNPFTKGPIKTANFIINENPEQLIVDCADTLRQGNSLVIFPEGTRTKPNQPMTFKKGTANIALRSGVAIRPVTITCRPSMLQKGVKWYNIPRYRPHFIIRVHDSFPVLPYLENDNAISVNARHLTQALHEFIRVRLSQQ